MNRSYDVAPVTPIDYRHLAEKRLPRFLFDYIDGGANDEQTMAANLADFAAVRLRQRVMRDVSGVNTSTTLAGRKVAMPLALAPVGMAGMFARRGEAMGVRAADHAGVRSRCPRSACAPWRNCAPPRRPRSGSSST